MKEVCLLVKDIKFFKLAEQVSKNSDHHQYMIGAVISKKNRVISNGCNTLKKTHPLQALYAKLTNNPEAIYLHAEMSAIVRAKEVDLEGATIHIFRRGLGGELRNSRPCDSCMRALIKRGIKKIHYTTDRGYATEELL